MKSPLVSKTIPMRVALYALLGLCLIYIYFIGFDDDLYPNTYLLRIGEKLSALQCLELYFIAMIIKRVDDHYSVRLIELTLATAISFGLFIALFRRPEYALALLTIAATLRFAKTPVVNVAMLSIAVFSFQYAGAFGPLFLFHKVFAFLDAAAIRTLLDIFGFAVGGAETIIRYPSTGMSVRVNVGCTSTLAMVYAVSGAIIYGIYQSARIDWRTVTGVFLLLLAVTLINWLRIALMLESMDAYEFWHKGMGMQIVALVDAIAILAITHLSIRPSRLSDTNAELI